MQQLELQHMHEDLEDLKRDVAVIKHILSEEGQLTEEAKKQLNEARQTSDSAYVKLD